MRRVGLIALLISLIGFGIVTIANALTLEEEEWFRQAAAPYKGITLRGVTESTAPSLAIADIIKEFENLQGLKWNT